ncbi:hypothetical protein BD779DRAFT_1677716 [Infundibulicybe gibba]|nr:hypothetical protein BD779DRAFT_1677716 [Infundibulicybe gibba]
MGSKPSRRKPNGPYLPTRTDAWLVQRMLAIYLPLELVDIILEDAMYGPRIHAFEDEHTRLSASQASDNDASQCCLITPPLPGPNELGWEWTNAKKIVFKISSHDQGWGGEPRLSGRYAGAYSWFEVIILRPTSLEQPWMDEHEKRIDDLFLEYTKENLVLPSPDDLQAFGYRYGESPLNDGGTRWMLQRNARANGATKNHEVTWTMDGASGDAGSGDGAGFVSALQWGDKVAVIARAQYPGWENHVESVQVDICYG